jgi:tetratricopeptide (TPR) repeat protein
MGAHYSFGPFVLDRDRGTLLRNGTPVPLGNRAVAVLGALLAAGSRVVAKGELLEAAWPGTAVEESNLSVQIAALRRLLGARAGGGEWITTVPRVGYRFAGMPDGAPAATRPAVLVEQFEGEGDGPVRGITEEIITALARFRWFSVTRQGREAHYVLTGRIRRSGQRVRISAQLVDATTGAHLWAEKFDAGAGKPFAVQDEIAERVAGAIEPELLRFEGASAGGGGSARDLVRRGTRFFHLITRETHFQARELFRQARELEPSFADAHVWIARVSGGIIAYGWSDDAVADAREGITAALTALRLDEQNAYAHYGLAIVSLYGGNLAQGLRAAERAVELNASFALGHLVLGMGRLFGGDAIRAIAPFERGLEISPHDPQNFVWFNLLALARTFAHRTTEALEAAEQVLKIRPDWRPGHETLILCLAKMGRWDDARRAFRHLQGMAVRPADALGPLRANNPAWADDMADCLLRAASTG